MLRAREPKLLNAEKASRMLDASTFEEAAKLLTDCGYDDMSQLRSAEIEQALSDHRKEIFDEIERLSPDKVIPELFRMKYDYHNAKVILKAEAMETESDHLFSDAGRISPAQLKTLYHEEKNGIRSPVFRCRENISCSVENAVSRREIQFYAGLAGKGHGGSSFGSCQNFESPAGGFCAG